jgi:hypothetical protein
MAIMLEKLEIFASTSNIIGVAIKVAQVDLNDTAAGTRFMIQ